MNDPKASLKLCLGICAYDGLLSDTELAVLLSEFEARGLINAEQFEATVDEFFEEDLTLEELYLKASPINDELNIAELAASVDGLDIAENIALQKCHLLYDKEE